MTTTRSQQPSKRVSSSKSKPKYRSPIAETIHKTAMGLHRAGVMSKKTMREFDKSCVSPVKEFTPKQIVQLRKREDASQAIFAYYLGIPVTLISQWERGEKKPSGPSLKLLSLVDKNGLDHVA